MLQLHRRRPRAFSVTALHFCCAVRTRSRFAGIGRSASCRRCCCCRHRAARRCRRRRHLCRSGAARRRHCAALLRRARPGRGARRRARRRHRRRRQWVAARGKLLGREHCEGGELDDSAPRQLAAQRLLQVDAPVLRLVRLLHKNMICSLKLIGFKNCSSRRGFSTTAQGAAKGRHAAGGTHGHGSSLRTALLHAQTVPTAPCSRW